MNQYLKKICFGIITFIFVNISIAQDTDIYENRQYKQISELFSFYNTPATRDIIDLCGMWQYAKENSSNWKDISIPASYDYVGTVVYRKQFRISSNFRNRHFRLICQGVNYRATIKLNDVLIGNHTGGHSRFSFDIPESIVKIGENNTIEITADNNYYQKDSSPYKPQICSWRNYNGILREVYIEVTPLISIDELQFNYELSEDLSTAELNARFKIQDYNVVKGGQASFDGTEVEYYIEVINYKTNQTLYRSETKKVRTSIQRYNLIDIDFQLDQPPVWNVDSPDHILIIVRLYTGNRLIDEEKLITGLRKTRIEKRKFYINGLQTDLLCVKRVEYHPDAGSSFNYELMEKDVLKIKNLGVNAVYTAYHPHHPYFYYLCDKYGLLVLEEMPAWNLSKKLLDSEEIVKTGVKYLEEIIIRDENHPSVVFWGVLNNSQSNETQAVEFVEKLRTRSEKLTGKNIFFSTRLFSNDIVYPYMDLSIVDLGFVDISDAQKTINSWKEKISEDKLILFQFGMHLNRLDSEGNFEPEDLNFQAKFILDRFRMIHRDSRVSGLIIDSFSDWKAPVPILFNTPEQSSYIYYKGLLDYYRNERPSYQIIKKLIKNGRWFV